MAKNRRTNKQANKSKRDRRRDRRRDRNRRTVRGGGYDDNPKNWVSPGYVVHQAFPPPGKDCASTPVLATSRIDPALYTGARGGLPGLAMNGGRWGFGGPDTWAVAPNADGAAFGQFTKIPCEPTDPRTPGLEDLNAQKAASAGAFNMPLNVAVKAFPPPYGAKGGQAQGTMGEPAPAGLTAGQSASPSSGMEGRYYPGDSDTRAYYAPTAGYGNVPLPNPPPANPAILMQTPYDARSYNQACIKTAGGKRKTRRGSTRRNRRNRRNGKDKKNKKNKTN